MRNKHLLAFMLALSFLTRLPLPANLFQNIDTPADYGALQSRSTLFYPLVGAVIALLLTLLGLLMPLAMAPLLQAFILVLVWTVMTGALHLDGLADAIDAAAASHKDPTRTLAVFSDPNAGPMAIVALVFVVFGKVLLVAELLMMSLSMWVVLLLVIAMSRHLGVLYMLFTHYAKEQGIAKNMDLKQHQSSLCLSCLALCVLSFFLVSFTTLITLFCSLAALLFFWRHYWLKKINGYTGDCVGALIELAELLILFVLYIGEY